MYNACVTVDYPQLMNPKHFSVLPVIEQLAHGRAHLHDHVILRECPEMLALVDAGHKLGPLEHVTINFQATEGGNADAAKQFADSLTQAFGQYKPVLPCADFERLLADNDGRLYAYICVHVNGAVVEKRLASIKVA